MPLLIKFIEMTDGPVLELGAGVYSTPLMHWLCHEKNRKLVTYESDPSYYSFAKRFRSPNHTVCFTKDWSDLDLETHWSVVLVDHFVTRRAIDTIRLKYKADYIIIHDSEGTSEEYGYDKVWPHFKYRLDWKDEKPWTTVVSNFKKL